MGNNEYLFPGKLSSEGSPKSGVETSTGNDDRSIVPDVLMVIESVAREENLPTVGPWYGDYGSGIRRSQTPVSGSAVPGACSLSYSTQRSSTDLPCKLLLGIL